MAAACDGRSSCRSPIRPRSPKRDRPTSRTGPAGAPSSPPAARSESVGGQGDRPGQQRLHLPGPRARRDRCRGEPHQRRDGAGRGTHAGRGGDGRAAGRRRTLSADPRRFAPFHARSRWPWPERPSLRACAAERVARGRPGRRHVVAGVCPLSPRRPTVVMPIQITDDPPNVEASLSDLEGGIVSNDRFYVRCNFPVPQLDAETWRLEVAGAFERPRSWTLDELRALPRVERIVTLECAGNGRTLMSPAPPGTPWGLGAVGTARFGGVRLADVLAASGLQAAATELVFTGADGGTVEPEGRIAYEFNLDLATAVGAEPILAWTMGGEPLRARAWLPVATGRARPLRHAIGEVADADHGGRAAVRRPLPSEVSISRPKRRDRRIAGRRHQGPFASSHRLPTGSICASNPSCCAASPGPASSRSRAWRSIWATAIGGRRE